MKKIVTLLLMIALLYNAKVQAQLEAVYAGAELYNTVYNGMQINYLAYYLKKDGSFNDNLEVADWKTRKTGMYTLKDGMLLLKFSDGKEPAKYLLNKNGNLESTAGIKHTLHKMQLVDRMPAGFYEMKSAAFSGGMGANTPGVFSSSANILYFDGNGKFTLDGSSIVSVGGDAANGTVAGKFEKNTAPTGGSYQLSNGEIVLNYNNGTISRHSFFYSPPAKENLVLLGGVFYFHKEPAITISEPFATGVPSASSIMEKLRKRYGGFEIDKIATVREIAVISPNLEATTLIDLVNRKVRVELRQGSKLILVKMTDNDAGWQWTNGITQPMSADEVTEFQLSFYQGIFGLHKKMNSYFQQGTVDNSKGEYMITFFVNGKKVIYLVGVDYTMKGNAYSITDKPNITVYRKFMQTGGISYPSETESSDGTTKITVTTKSVDINPVLKESDWKKP